MIPSSPISLPPPRATQLLPENPWKNLSNAEPDSFTGDLSSWPLLSPQEKIQLFPAELDLETMTTVGSLVELSLQESVSPPPYTPAMVDSVSASPPTTPSVFSSVELSSQQETTVDSVSASLPPMPVLLPSSEESGTVARTAALPQRRNPAPAPHRHGRNYQNHQRPNQRGNGGYNGNRGHSNRAPSVPNFRPDIGFNQVQHSQHWGFHGPPPFPVYSYPNQIRVPSGPESLKPQTIEPVLGFHGPPIPVHPYPNHFRPLFYPSDEGGDYFRGINGPFYHVSNIPPAPAPPRGPVVAGLPPLPVVLNRPGVPTPRYQSLLLGLRHQIEYYFSDENLEKDGYLREQMDGQGWVSMHKIALFHRASKMIGDLIQEALQYYSVVGVPVVGLPTVITCIWEALLSSSAVDLRGEKMRKKFGWDRWTTQDLLAASMQNMQLNEQLHRSSSSSSSS